MKDQPSTSKDNQEPPRPKTIPDDFIWDPELQAWYAPGEPSGYDAEAEYRETLRICEEVRRQPPIPREKLRVPPGTLDVPPSWRKSLGGGERDLFSALDDSEAAMDQDRAELETGDEASADGDA